MSAALCAPLTAAGDGFESDFLEPVSIKAKPCVELYLPLAGMNFERAAAQLDRAREMGVGCALLTVGTADVKTWELLADLMAHARENGLELGLRDFFVAPEEDVALPRLRHLTWGAYPVQGPSEIGTNFFPSVFCDDGAFRRLTCLAMPEADSGGQSFKPLDISGGGSITTGGWQLVRFGTVEMDPPVPDYFVDMLLARHVNRWLSECQSRLSSGYGRTVRWYQISMPTRRELVWTEDLPAEFLKLSGLGLERHLPALAGFKVGGEAVTEHVRRQSARAVRALWRERIGKTVDELVYAAGLDAGISVDQTPLDPEEVAMYFRLPMIICSRDEASAQANRRASGGARAMGRRLVTGRLAPADEVRTPAEAILPFPWKRAADRLLAEGATRLLLDTGGIVPEGTDFAEMRELCRYLHRCQTLLNKGEPVADMLVWAEALPSVLEGYSFDCANDEMLAAAFFEDRCVCFDSERSYRHVAVTAAVLRQDGAEKLVRRLASNGVRVWLVPAGAAGEKEAFGVFGQGRGTDAIRLLRDGAEGLPAMDFRWASEVKGMALDFVHRRTEGHEIYFVVNAGEAAGPVTCVFRDTGKGVAARWDPVKGEIGLLAGNARRQSDGSVSADFFMEPFDACFIVFER
ncbi:MAG: hypothetical protein PHU80_10510 [Kiritimatiellae bacterium]|nr:hypothetical protein [Kiritimatiellia bacterium]